MPDRPAIEQFVTFVYCADLARAARFYQDIVGLDMVLDQGACRIYRVAGEAYIGICQRVDVRGPFADDVILTFATQDVDGWHDYLRAAGVEIDKPPQVDEDYNIYHLLVRDPDGHLLEFQTFRDPAWPKPA